MGKAGLCGTVGAVPAPEPLRAGLGAPLCLFGVGGAALGAERGTPNRAARLAAVKGKDPGLSFPVLVTL